MVRRAASACRSLCLAVSPAPWLPLCLAIWLAALELFGCSAASAPPSPTARRVSLVLAWTEEEHSKDSHTRGTTYQLDGGVLRASRSWSGYYPGRPPAPTTSRVAVGDPELGRLIDRVRAAGLERPASSDVGQLDGPGNVVTLDLQLTVDGRSARSRSVLRRSWRDEASQPPPLHAALLELTAELDRIDRGDR